MRSLVTYDKSTKSLSCENQSNIPNFCKECIKDKNKKCQDFYKKMLNKEEEGLYYCPYKFGVYLKRNNLYSCLIIKNNSFVKLKESIEKYKQKISDFHCYTEKEIIDIINDFENLIMDNLTLRDCMHDLRNIGSFFNAMIERVKQKYNDLYESDDDIKALTSLYELVNYRINILNGINHANNRRFKQKIHPLIKKLTILLSYQANKKDLKFKIEEVQNNYITISDNIYLAMFILLENAVKHSFSGNDINIGFEEDSDNLIVTIENIGEKIERDETDK